MGAPTRRKIFDVVGEGRETRDGTPRQQVILHCNPGDRVVLERQPDNQHDRNAVLIVCEGGDVGFLGRDDAALIAPALDGGAEYQAQIHQITGGVPDAPAYGLKIAVVWAGQKLPEPFPLDEMQVRSRRGKLAAKGRERDSRGAFAGGKKTGCLSAVIMVALPVIAIGVWTDV